MGGWYILYRPSLFIYFDAACTKGRKIYEYSKDHLLFDTMHAVSMTTDEGVELLVHIGLETVTLKGKHFTAHKATGDTVHQVSIS